MRNRITCIMFCVAVIGSASTLALSKPTNGHEYDRAALDALIERIVAEAE